MDNHKHHENTLSPSSNNSKLEENSLPAENKLDHEVNSYQSQNEEDPEDLDLTNSRENLLASPTNSSYLRRQKSYGRQNTASPSPSNSVCFSLPDQNLEDSNPESGREELPVTPEPIPVEKLNETLSPTPTKSFQGIRNRFYRIGLA